MVDVTTEATKSRAVYDPLEPATSSNRASRKSPRKTNLSPEDFSAAVTAVGKR